MNKKKQVIRVFLLSLFITIICLSTEVFAAETIGSISNPASLKVGGETHKYFFRKSEDDQVITSQVGISLEEIMSGSEAEAFDKEFNTNLGTSVDPFSLFYIPKTATTSLYIFKFKLEFYSSDVKTALKGFDMLSENGFYTQDNVPITAYDYMLFNYSEKNEYVKEITAGTDPKTNTATFYYAVYLEDYKSGQYPIIELKNMGLFRYTSFVNTDPNYTPDTNVESTTSSKLNISNAKISGLKTKIYNGTKHTQNITVTYGSTVLKNNVDYDIYYTHNKNVGSAIVYIMGKGNYYGHRLTSFKISPPAPSVVKYTHTSNQINIYWSNVPSALGYTVYMYHPIKKKWITKGSILSPLKNKATITTDYDGKPLKPAAGYIFKIMPYKYYLNSLTMEFDLVEYAYKQLSIFTRPAASTIQKVSNSKKGTISLTYSKSTRASGYLVQVYSSNNKLVKKVITRGNYAKFTGLASGKKYLVKVIPYRLINGKPLYCSNPKYKYVITK